MRNPLVSVIVPVYNVEKYLYQCLESIVIQTYSNIEVIVVNDGSPDNSDLIIKEFSSKDSRIKLINQKNAGLSAARNAGIKDATGEYIMFVDSDDWIESSMVEELLSKVKGVDLVVCSYNRMYTSKSNPRVLNVEGELNGTIFQRKLVGLYGSELKDPSQVDAFSIACAKLYKTDIIKKELIQFVSTKKIGTEDLLFNIQYSNQISRCYIYNEPLYNYRRDNEGSLTSTFKPKLFVQWQLLYSIIQGIIIDKESIFKIAFQNRVCIGIIGLGLNEMQSSDGFLSRYKKLKFILNDDLYKKAYSSLNLNYFPLHWKLFFGFAKYRFVLGVYAMLLGINYFVNSNK